MLLRLLRLNQTQPTDTTPDEVIARAKRWQNWLRWLAWLLPVAISIGVYAFVWYGLVLPGQSIVELRQASNVIFFSALASLVLGILIYQIQIVIAQQVATSAELERKVQERTQHITEVMRQLDDQNKALVALDRQKSEFVTLVSHELRAPLTNINGGLELILSREHDLSPRTRSTIELVVAEAGRLTHFVETILNISALEAGQLPITLGPVVLRPVVEYVIGQFPGLAPGRIAVELPDDLPVVSADERFLQSVVFHLIDNALKYAPDSPIWIKATRSGETDLVLSVIDHGPGVPAESVNRIFNMFERLSAKDSQTEYGYGLGLYMCKRILAAFQGDIELVSQPGEGTTFLIRLRLWKNEQNA
jgi:signal transduction histidine kinase